MSKKPALLIDTCVWIELAKGPAFKSILTKLHNLVMNREVILLVPEQIEIEWNRHKGEIVQGIKESYKGKMKNAKEIKDILPDAEKETYQDFLNKIHSISQNYFDEIADENIDLIDEMLDSGKLITSDDAVYKKVVEFGLKKKKPFLKKNSTGDAILFFSTYYYLKLNPCRNVYFVTFNLEDFSVDKGENRGVIADELKDYAEKVKMKYFINIGNAINDVKANLIPKREMEKVNVAVEKAVLNYTQQKCPNCGTPMYSAWLRSPYGGLEWTHHCRNCNTRIGTGEYFD